MSEGKIAPLPNPQAVPTNPRAAAYAAGRQRGGPVKYTEPVAGGRTPPIPRLDQPHADGATMSQVAVGQRRLENPGSIIQPPPSSGPDIRPSDLLPAQAQKDPNFLQGQGSMYASAQPHLAMKYGVIRDGKPLSPQQLMARPTTPGGPPKTQLRPETMQDLETLNKLREQSLRAESGESGADQASMDSSAGAAAGIGTARIGTGPAPEKPMTSEEMRKALGEKDEFDLSTLHEMMVKDIINNDDQRKIVEARLDKLNLADLVVNGTVTQNVPIIPGDFEVEFESLTGEDDLNMKRMIIEEAKALKVDDRYLLDKYALMGLACAVRAINKKNLGTHRDNNGDFNEEALEKKFKRILKLPLPMLAAIGPHYFWFDQRVRRLFVAEKVKNG